MIWFIGGTACFVVGILFGFRLRNSTAEIAEENAREAVRQAQEFLRHGERLWNEAVALNKKTVALLNRVEVQENGIH